MSTAPKLTWLHVSDLHFGHGDAHYRFDQQGVTGAILRDAEERAKLLGSPDLIIVTGDIAFSGQKEQYAQAKDWLTQLRAKVGGSPRLFMVPGNHDVDRKQAAKVAAAAVLDVLRRDPQKLDGLLEDRLKDPSALEVLWPNLRAYAEFANGLQSPALTAANPFYSQEVECPLGGKLIVVGLNTALLCLNDEDGPKTLALGRGQILKAIEQQPTDALLLVLQHHPPEWLSDGKDLAAYLQLRPQIQFSGHVHQQQGVVHMPLLGGTRLQFVAGAGHMDQKEDGSHAYAWGQLSEEGLAYHSRVWLPERKGFAPATMLDSDDFKRGDHAFVERARLPKKLGNWLPAKAPKTTRKAPAPKKVKPAALPPSAPTVPGPTAAVVPFVLPSPQAESVKVLQPSVAAPASMPTARPTSVGVAWVVERGEDRHGLFMSFAVGEVVQKLRWIPPGRFMMGSPESEAGRWEHEGPQHEVELTEGFWLAETPCTQALWQAVMGKNPSHFVGPDLPVEQVSWKDCQEFFNRLNQRVPELQARLPSEAEWEYACRAGTTTATWVGDLTIGKDRSAPELEKIAWYNANGGSKTHPVRTKTVNPWGLYDMLGNVVEWCQDWSGRYDGVVKSNPTGPEVGSKRVLRGGAWYFNARFVRAATRFGVIPGYRFDFMGFRVARGQKPGI